MCTVHPVTHVLAALPLLVWRLATPRRCISSGPLGGGIGLRHWVLNASVDADYARSDPAEHLREIAAHLGLSGCGVGLLTAVDVRRKVTVAHEGLTVTATTGVGHPTWAVLTEPVPTKPKAPPLPGTINPGTINIVVHCPAACTDAALVNLVGTVTEAKTQALLTYGIAGTGTATDTVTALCATEGTPESFGGTRSTWGGRAASAVFDAVYAGLKEDRGRAARAHQPWRP